MAPWDNPYPATEDPTPEELLRFFETQKANEDFWGRIGFTRFQNSSVLFRDLATRAKSIETIVAEGVYDDDPKVVALFKRSAPHIRVHQVFR